MLRVVAKNFIQPDKVELGIKICREMMAATKKEAGCIFYDAYQEADDPTTLVFLEAWEDQKSLDDHIRSEHFVTLIPQLKGIARQDWELKIYKKPL